VDCSKDKNNVLCCPEMLKDPMANEKEYAHCCTQPQFHKNPKCACKNILEHPSKYPKSTVCDNCLKKLTKDKTPSQEVKDLCTKCDCKADPEQECCNSKCGEVFQNPFANLQLFDECCKNSPAEPACQCSAILRILPGAKGNGYDMKTMKSKTMNNCCHEVSSNDKPAYGVNLGCENCPTNEMCCAEYLKDVKGYTSKYASLNPTAFEAFSQSCCSADSKWKENGCPEPKCNDTPYSDVRCCDSLTKSSPNDQNLKACC